jgi:hypothetical protein
MVKKKNYNAACNTSDGEKAEKTKDWLKILLLSTNQKTALLYKVEL